MDKPTGPKFPNGTRVTPVWEGVQYPPGIVISTILALPESSSNHVVLRHDKSINVIRDLGPVVLCVWNENCLSK